MTRFSALVVDDEWPARSYLVELLTESGWFHDIVAVATVADAVQAMEEGAFEIDVAFVDIRLVDTPGDTSGLALAQSLSKLPMPPAIVLATASPDYALDGFELGVADYLLKPFRLDRVRQCAERLATRVRGHAERHQRLAARKGRTLVFLEMSGLLAFQAADRLTRLHHDTGIYDVDLSLRALDASLGERVIRVHRNWLVAPERVRELSKASGELTLTLGNELVVPVSRERARDVRRALLAGAVGLSPPR